MPERTHDVHSQPAPDAPPPPPSARRLVRFAALALATATVLTNAYYLRFLEPAVSRRWVAAAVIGLCAIVVALAEWGLPRGRGRWRDPRPPRRRARPARPPSSPSPSGCASGASRPACPRATSPTNTTSCTPGCACSRAATSTRTGGSIPASSATWPSRPTPSSSSSASRAGAGSTSATSPSRTCSTGAASSASSSGTLTVLVAYLLGRRLFGARVGLLSAALLAVFPAAVQHSQYNKPDPVIALMTAVSVLVTLVYLERGGSGYALASGIAVGLAASAKYNGVLVVVPFVLAVALPRRMADPRAAGPLPGRDRHLPRLPHRVPVLPDRDPSLPRPDRARHLHVRLRRARGRGRRRQLGEPRRLHVALRRGLVGDPRGRGRPRADALPHQPRARGVPDLPGDVLRLLRRAADQLPRQPDPGLPVPGRPRRLRRGGGCSTGSGRTRLGRAAARRARRGRGRCSSCVIVPPLRTAVRFDIEATRPDTGTVAREWIDKTFPPGTKFAVERFTPVLDTKRYADRPGITARQPQPAQLPGRGSAVPDRVVDGVRRYGAEHNQTRSYEKLIAICPTVAEFDPVANQRVGPTIRILRVPPSGGGDEGAQP